MVRISVIVPTYNRARELRLCLEGFASQTVSRDCFEVIVVDDGSPRSVEPLVNEFAGSIRVLYRRIPNSGPAAARNLGIELASAPLLILYDDDLRPRPFLIAHCLAFHESWPETCRAALLRFKPAPSIRGLPLVRCVFDRMYPFPSMSSLGSFWSGTLTCKKELFRHEKFDEQFRALEDLELEIRLRRRLDLRIHFDHRNLGVYTRVITLAPFLVRCYTWGYYDYLLARKYPGIWGRETPYEPERLLVAPPELRGLIASTEAMLARCPEPGSPSHDLLVALLVRTESHARADGWQTARDGRECKPPATR